MKMPASFISLLLKKFRNNLKTNFRRNCVENFPARLLSHSLRERFVRIKLQACLGEMQWQYCWKPRGDTFFNETAFLFWCHALWKLGSSNCCIFEMEHATGMKTCTKIFFLLIFILVEIRSRKISLFWLYNLLTLLWKPSIKIILTFAPSWCMNPDPHRVSPRLSLENKFCHD